MGTGDAPALLDGPRAAVVQQGRQRLFERVFRLPMQQSAGTAGVTNEDGKIAGTPPHGILLNGNLDAASRYQALKDLDIRREDAAASIAMPKHLDQLDRSEKITNAK